MGCSAIASRLDRKYINGVHLWDTDRGWRIQHYPQRNKRQRDRHWPADIDDRRDADDQLAQPHLRHGRRSTVHFDRERHKLYFNFDGEVEWNGAGHDVCFIHATYGHSASLSYRHCWHGICYCCELWGNIRRSDVYDRGDARHHKPAHGVWDSRSCLLLYDYSNQQPNHLERKPAASRPECEYEHRSDFGNPDNGRDN